MTAFLAGVTFGAIFTASVFVAFITRARRSDHGLEQWEDPFSEPPPIEAKTTINKRQYTL